MSRNFNAANDLHAQRRRTLALQQAARPTARPSTHPPDSRAAVHRTRNTDTLPPRQTCAAYDNRRATAEKGKPIARWGRKASGPGTSQDSGVAGPDGVSTRDARLVVIPPLSEPVKDRTAHRIVTIRSVNGARARAPPDGKDAGEWLG